MLVITRGPNDKVVFPTLGISVEILRVTGRKVRLGVEAPREIPVLRHEVDSRRPNDGGQHPVKNVVGQGPDLSNSAAAGRSRLSHSARNRLNAAALGLHYLQRKLELGEIDGAELAISRILSELKAIESTESDPDNAAQRSANRPQRPQRRALVVEDNANERELLAGYLELNGFDVDTATDGMQAMVRLTQHGPPDVVLLDMRMPLLDGPQTVSAIRSDPQYNGLRLFAVSGTRQRDMDVPLGPGGIDRWFSKPLDPKVLIQAIQEDLAGAGAPA